MRALHAAGALDVSLRPTADELAVLVAVDGVEAWPELPLAPIDPRIEELEGVLGMLVIDGLSAAAARRRRGQVRAPIAALEAEIASAPHLTDDVLPLEAYRRRYEDAALDSYPTRGAAADALGVHPRTLTRRL